MRPIQTNLFTVVVCALISNPLALSFFHSFYHLLTYYIISLFKFIIYFVMNKMLEYNLQQSTDFCLFCWKMCPKSIEQWLVYKCLFVECINKWKNILGEGEGRETEWCLRQYRYYSKNPEHKNRRHGLSRQFRLILAFCIEYPDENGTLRISIEQRLTSLISNTSQFFTKRRPSKWKGTHSFASVTSKLHILFSESPWQKNNILFAQSSWMCVSIISLLFSF